MSTDNIPPEKLEDQLSMFENDSSSQKEEGVRAMATTTPPGNRTDQRTVGKNANRTPVKEGCPQPDSRESDRRELSLPRSGATIPLRWDFIDPSLIDISPSNARAQELLTVIATSDLLPSIEQFGQQAPGLLRPRDNGRFELIAGSRRLWCARYLKREFFACIGAIPDADIKALTEIENTHKPLSDYEIALSIQQAIDQGAYKTWDEAAKALSLSPATLSGYKAIVDLPVEYVRVFPDPNGLTVKRASQLRAWCYKSDKIKNALLSEVKTLLVEKERAIAQSNPHPDAPSIMSRLTNAVTTTTASTLKVPTPKRPERYKSKDGAIRMTHRISGDGTRPSLVFEGVSPEIVNDIIGYITKKLNLAPSSPGEESRKT